MSTPHISAAARERTVWVTAPGGVVDHAVLQLDLARWTCEPGRDLPSICGETFWPAPMIADPGPCCFRCARFLRARAPLRSFDERLGATSRHRRPSLVRKFWSSVLPQVPADSLRSPRCVSPGGSTGHARRGFDAPGYSWPSGSRRVSIEVGRPS